MATLSYHTQPEKTIVFFVSFGIITIPKMDLEMPLYLGANEANMANGAAVLSQTSVPLGGENTNAVIAGHRGYNGYPYFKEIEESVREQIDYEILAERYPLDDPDCILELMCDVLCSTAPTLRIGSENIPTPKVQERYRRLNSEHIAYVLDALRETTTKIWNIRAYLLTALYNAPITMGQYYAAAVRHDYG